MRLLSAAEAVSYLAPIALYVHSQDIFKGSFVVVVNTERHFLLLQQ